VVGFGHVVMGKAVDWALAMKNLPSLLFQSVLMARNVSKLPWLSTTLYSSLKMAQLVPVYSIIIFFVQT
jgi:hypothetical protein